MKESGYLREGHLSRGNNQHKELQLREYLDGQGASVAKGRVSKGSSKRLIQKNIIGGEGSSYRALQPL